MFNFKKSTIEDRVAGAWGFMAGAIYVVAALADAALWRAKAGRSRTKRARINSTRGATQSRRLTGEAEPEVEVGIDVVSSDAVANPHVRALTDGYLSKSRQVAISDSETC